MQRVGEFERVSYEQFYKATKKEWPFLEDAFIALAYEKIEIPSRATSGSAGFDFKSYLNFELKPGETAKIPTGIRVQIDEGWWLGCLPRSSLGFKYRVQLDNTVGVIDSDYYWSDNEGHIFVKITNDGKENKTLRVDEGDAFIQAIFIPYGITYSDDAKGVRNGGMGSTGK